MVEVPDSFDEKKSAVFCSIECACYAGHYRVKGKQK